jgi:dTDP-glucose pyrophosphorylase
MINIVVPMAGRGSRFSQAGYISPKPLLPVFGRPMIEVVIENLRPNQPHRFIFICQREHLVVHELETTLLQAGTETLIVPIDYVTDGAACTVLLAEAEINNDDALMIANCDQYIATSIDTYLNHMEQGGFDGFIMTMTAKDPKWSFIGLDDKGVVNQVVEKQVVSDEATVGIYNYRSGRSFVAAAKEMIGSNDRTNNEFYVAPAYNYMIKYGMRVGYMNIGSDRAGMYGLGTPTDFEYFNSLAAIPIGDCRA